MKIKFLVLLMTITGAIINAQAQNLIGVNGYYQFCTINTDSAKFSKSIHAVPDYGFGLVYKHFELGPIGLQAGVNVEGKGFCIETENGYKYKQHLQYVNIPLGIHLDIGKHAIKGIIHVGIYGDILLNAPAAKYDCDVAEFAGFQRLVDAEYNKFTYGVVGSAGFAICTGAGVFQFEVRASQAMSKAADLGELSLFNYVETRTLGGMVSYLVPFGKTKYYTKREKKPDLSELDNLDIKTDTVKAVEKPLEKVNVDKGPEIPYDDFRDDDDSFSHLNETIENDSLPEQDSVTEPQTEVSQPESVPTENDEKADGNDNKDNNKVSDKKKKRNKKAKNE